MFVGGEAEETNSVPLWRKGDSSSASQHGASFLSRNIDGEVGETKNAAPVFDFPDAGRRAVAAVVAAYAPLRRRGGASNIVLTEGAAGLIYGAVERRLVQLLTLAIRLSRRSLRVGCKGRLTVADVKEASKALNLKPLLGYEGLSTSRFVLLPVEFEAHRVLKKESVRPIDPLAVFVEASRSHRGRHDEDWRVSSSDANAAFEFSPSLTESCAVGSVSSLVCLISSPPLLQPSPPPALAVHWAAVEGQAAWLPQNELPLTVGCLIQKQVDATEEAVREEAEETQPTRSAASLKEEESRLGCKTQRGDTEQDSTATSAAAEAETASSCGLRASLKRRSSTSKETLLLCSPSTSSPSCKKAVSSSGRDRVAPVGEDDALPFCGMKIDQVLVAPKLSHILGREQQLFLSSVEECLEAAVSEKFPGDCWRLFLKTLRLVASTCVVEALAAPLCRMFSIKLGDSLCLPHRASLLLMLAEAIIANEFVSLHSHVHQLLIPLMDCLLQPLPLSGPPGRETSSGASANFDEDAVEAFLPMTPQAQVLRRRAARVFGLLCARCFRERNGLQSVATAAAHQLLRHLLHPLSCLDTAAGAALGLVEIGRESVRNLLLPHAPLLLHALERGQELNELQLLAVFAARQKPHSAREDSTLVSKQQALYLRAALAEDLQQILLSSVLNELSYQIEERSTLLEDCAAPDEVLANLLSIICEAPDGLRDRFVPLVTAAFRRAFSRRPCGAMKSAWRAKGGALSVEAAELASQRRKAEASALMSKVLHLLSLMEETVNAEEEMRSQQSPRKRLLLTRSPPSLLADAETASSLELLGSEVSAIHELLTLAV